MPSICYIFVAILFVMLPKTGHANNAPAIWHGSYLYEYDEGRTVPGIEAVLSYELRIDDSQSKSCILSITGYQTDEEILCETSGNSQQITIIFKSFDDGKITNRYGKIEYEVGAPLLILRHHNLVIETSWLKLSPDPDKIFKAGAYFKKNN